MFDSQSSQFSQNKASYNLFPDQPIEDKSEIEKNIEAMKEAERKFQNMLASPYPQNFQDSYSVPPLQNEQPSVLKIRMKVLRESER